MNALKEILDPLIHKAIQKRGFEHCKDLLLYWPQWVGHFLAKHSFPQKLSHCGYPKALALHVQVNQGGVALELQHNSVQILDRIRASSGVLVEKLILHQGPILGLTSKKIRSVKIETSDWEDIAAEQDALAQDGLDCALKRLGKHISTKQRI